MIGRTEKIWLILISLTCVGALLGEQGQAGWLLTLTVVILLALKGSIVIDQYMEMRTANQRIRNILHLFVILISILVIVSYLWGDNLRRFTALE